jgi:hypothetical protein
MINPVGPYGTKTKSSHYSTYQGLAPKREVERILWVVGLEAKKTLRSSYDLLFKEERLTPQWTRSGSISGNSCGLAGTFSLDMAGVAVAWRKNGVSITHWVLAYKVLPMVYGVMLCLFLRNRVTEILSATLQLP